MAQCAITYDNALLLIKNDAQGLHTAFKLEGTNPISIAQDPLNSNILYCGTFDRGLWKSTDKGDTWAPIGTRFTYNSPFKKDDIHMTSITAVTVVDTGKSSGTVIVGTEPSALFISYNEGQTFELLTDFEHIQGKNQWFFPPRPFTHHVKWFDTNIKSPGTINLTIEAGGFIQSRDYGQTWTTFIDGIKYRYGYGLAVNSNNSSNIVIATSNSPFNAHNYDDDTFSTIYYVDKEHESAWTEADEGLPAPEGTLISAISEKDGIFYIANNKGVFYSESGGKSWTSLAIEWPESLTHQHAHQFITLN